MITFQAHTGSQRGAALLFLLAIAGLMGALFLMNVFQVQNRDRLNEQATQINLNNAREALIGFATQHGRLPKPAISGIDGRENVQECDTQQKCSGFLPWVALGINGTDSWGNPLRYSVTPAYTSVPIRATIVGGTMRVKSRDHLGKLFFLAGQDECPLYAECPPAVLISSGKYSSRSLGGDKTRNNLDELQNSIATNEFISRPKDTSDEAKGGEFDDIVIWLPSQTLYKRMRQAHTLQ